MNEHTFEYYGVKITTHRETIRDRLNADIVKYKLGDSADLAEGYLERTFARFITQSTVEGLGFALPSASAPNEEIKVAFEKFMSLDPGLLEQWKVVAAAVNAKPNDPVLLPPVDVPESEKKEQA